MRPGRILAQSDLFERLSPGFLTTPGFGFHAYFPTGKGCRRHFSHIKRTWKIKNQNIISCVGNGFVTIGVLMIVILIATVYVVLNTYDYNKLKPLVARMVEDATGRKLSLGGEVNLEIGLMPDAGCDEYSTGQCSLGFATANDRD